MQNKLLAFEYIFAIEITMLIIMKTNNQNPKAMFLHLSAYGQYIFPLGNFVLPLVLWAIMKNDSASLDNHGRRVLNFQLSLWLYSAVLLLIAIPVFMFGVFSHFPADFNFHGTFSELRGITLQEVTGYTIFGILSVILGFAMHFAAFFFVLIGAVKAMNGQPFNYPASIPFFGYVSEETEENTTDASSDITSENTITST